MKSLVLVSALGLAILGTSCATSTDTVDSMLHSFTNVSSSVTNAKPASQRKQLDANLEGVDVSVNYGSPSVKGRDLWDALVPYDAVWRTGANQATTIKTSGDLMVQGQLLPAGHYALFTIPTAAEWTVIFNEQHEQWGSNSHDESLDVLRVKTMPATSDMSESLEFSAGAGGALTLHWGTLSVPIMLAPAS
ncbi:MAG: hypothetical protein ACJAQ3_001234 [Planctomycetota bacterium]|jgi:hypothetical protein